MPVRSDFSDNNTKSFFCALPDGRYLYIGTPDNTRLQGHLLLLLVLDSPEDGFNYDKCYILSDDRYTWQYEGRWKSGDMAIRSPTSAKADLRHSFSRTEASGWTPLKCKNLRSKMKTKHLLALLLLAPLPLPLTVGHPAAGRYRGQHGAHRRPVVGEASPPASRSNRHGASVYTPRTDDDGN